ncbi:hypothetical protein SG26_03105 [Haloarcula sp. CBA1115]|uniref:glycosyltransferase family 61 protein n=1 Tax=unclassified Haloarcula TaxID=2624677 RepID=UPI000595586B|nr:MULTISPECIES: glycosyltransferase family 61 protein [unclassified Haloarcula]AJF24771.1 hypothetical protein SG26_03105 [Haloarcula sp. CBA1115]
MDLQKLFTAAKAKFLAEGPESVATAIPPFLLSRFIFSPYFFPEERILRSDDLHKYSQTTGRVWQYENGREASVTPVRESEKLPWNFRQWERVYDEGSSYLYEIPNCRLIGKEAIGFNAEGDILLNLARNHHHNLLVRANEVVAGGSGGIRERSRYLFPSVGSPDVTYSVVFQMVADPENYYTWVTEHLPKLRGVKTYVDETGLKPTLLLRPDPPSYMTESLELLGFDSYEWAMSSTGISAVDRLVACTHRRHNVGGRYEPHPSGYEWLRDCTVDNVDAADAPSRVWVSRQDATVRKATNSDAVIEALSERGFKSVTPGEMSFKDQVTMFASADVVAGIHGAGLTNMIWSDDPHIIEVIPEDKLTNLQGPTYYCLARNLGYDYDFITAKGGVDGVDIDVTALCNAVDERLEEN